MAQRRVLSTDPNAGQAQPARRVLSTDPNAGSEPEQPAEAFGAGKGARLTGPRTWGESFRENLPMIGGVIGGLIGAPGVATATGGAALGAGAGEAGRQLIRRVQGLSAPASPTEAAISIGKEGAIQGAAEIAGLGLIKGVRSVGAPLAGAGLSAYERMLKPTKSNLSQASKFGESLPERSRNMAEALIQDPAGQISKRGASRYGAGTDVLQGKVDALIEANPEARGSTQHLTDALGGGKGRFSKQWAPQGDEAAYGRVVKDVLENPRVTKSKRAQVTRTTADNFGRFSDTTAPEVVGTELIPRVRAKTARELTQGTYRKLGDAAYGELKGAEKEAQKAAARGGRAIVDEAVPEATPINAEISKRIDLGELLDEAAFRSGKHNTIGLGDLVSLASGNPGWLAASLINRPGIGSPLARGAYRVGKALDPIASHKVTGQTARQLPRASRALLQALLGQEEEP